MKAPAQLSTRSLLGHLGEFKDEPQQLLQRFNAECGDIGWLRFVTTRVLVLNTPELIKELLVTRYASFQKSRVMRLALAPLAGEGLFTSDGELWRRQRKLMSPIFQPAHIAEYDSLMTACARSYVDAWTDGQELDALHETTGIAMSVAGRSLFDADISAESDDLGEALTVALEWAAGAVTSVPFALQVQVADAVDKARPRLPEPIKARAQRAVDALGQPIMWPTADNRRLQQAIATLDARVHKMIADRRHDPTPRSDLLSRLLRAHEGVEGQAMSDRQLRDEVLTLFVAGHETTATALAWSLYLLARHPKVRDALEREVDALGDTVPGAAELPRLPLATKVFKEALRMYPPVPIYERQAIEPVELGGLHIEPGTYVGIFPWALHNRPHLWPEPHAFDPERFSPEAEAARDRYAWIPFGAGPRVCIGIHFALQEGPLVLATIVRRARLELRDEREIEPDPHAATLRPLGGIPMRVQMRP